MYTGTQWVPAPHYYTTFFFCALLGYQETPFTFNKSHPSPPTSVCANDGPEKRIWTLDRLARKPHVPLPVRLNVVSKGARYLTAYRRCSPPFLCLFPSETCMNHIEYTPIRQ